MSNLVEVRDLEVAFHGRRPNLLGRRRLVAVVRGVTLSIGENETLGLVGESGSGKTTTGRAIVGLAKVSGGEVKFRGGDVPPLGRKAGGEVRRQIQMIFQDPYTSLDPSMRVSDIVAEPYDTLEDGDRRERDHLVRDALTAVGLDADLGRRYPRQFSGGQRQRIAIARAMLLRPSFIVCDEPVSALDASTKNHVVSLLQRLQREHGSSYLFISHDLPIVRHVSRRIAVMYAGRIVEVGPAKRVSEHPAHPYSAALVAASPYPDPARERSRRRILLEGDPPSPVAPPSGCAFHPRCPFAMEICRVEVPEATPVEGGGEVACHLQTSGPSLAGVPMSDVPADSLGGTWRLSVLAG